MCKAETAERMNCVREMVELVDAFEGTPTQQDLEQIARAPFKARDLAGMFELREQRARNLKRKKPCGRYSIGEGNLE